MGAGAVGISPDKPAAQKKFDTKYGLGFALLSDEDHAVAEATGGVPGGEESSTGAPPRCSGAQFKYEPESAILWWGSA